MCIVATVNGCAYYGTEADFMETVESDCLNSNLFLHLKYYCEMQACRKNNLLITRVFLHISVGLDPVEHFYKCKNSCTNKCKKVIAARNPFHVNLTIYCPVHT